MSLPPRVARFRDGLVAVSALAHAPFATACVQTARICTLSLAASASIAGGLVVLSVVACRRRVDAVLDDHPGQRRFRHWFAFPYFVHWFACLLATVLSLIVAVFFAIYQWTFGTHGALLPAPAVTTIYFFSLLVGVWSVYPGRTRFSVREREVAVSGLPSTFDGYRIAQLSDIHIGGLLSKEDASPWIDAANKAKPDITVITGDSVTNGVLFHTEIAETLAPLRAPDGVFYAMGNHDYFNEGQPMRDLLTASGITVLRNEGRSISRGDDVLFLAGVDDLYTRKADLPKTLEERPTVAGRPATTVLLAHDPAHWPAARRQGVELTLSGHTHGGQVAMPFFAERFSLSSLAHRYHLGFYREGDAVLFVHPGLGTTGPPVRIGVPAEVTILVLRAATRGEAKLGDEGTPAA